MDMVFNATFNNISVISWWSVLLAEETGENTAQPKVTIMYMYAFQICEYMPFSTL